MTVRETKLRQTKLKRAKRVRKALKGTASKPRMCLVKSNRHIEVQLVDDEKGITVSSVSSKQKKFKDTEWNRKSKKTARRLGQEMADSALAQNIKAIIFDRGPHKYHGILAEFADAARGAGLKF